MSDFNTEILKEISEKVVLLQLDIGKDNAVWVPYAAGVWIVNFNNMYASEDAFTDIPDAPSISSVGSVTVNGIQLSKVSTPSACISQDSSFYYEAGTLTLYIHCPFGNRPWLFKVRIGQVYGFRYGGHTASYGNVIYEDRLVNPSALTQSKDPQFYGTLALDSMTFRLINSDRTYDLLTRESNVFGNKGRILVGFDGWNITDFQQRFEGMIGNIKTDEEFIEVEVKDQRASLTIPVPYNVFTTEDYPGLNQSDVNVPIPRVFGTCRNCPVYVVDQDQDTDTDAGDTVTYHAKISDTEYTSAISAISAIYVNGSPVTSTVQNLGTRLFTLIHTTDTNDQYSPGDEVTCDLVGEVDNTGTVIENGAEVIRKLLLDYYDIAYTGDFFNFAHWFEGRARDIGLWLGKDQVPLIDVIGQICSEGIQGDFFYDGDGKFCLKIFREIDPSVQTIKRNQILNTPSIQDNPYETITSTLIGYSKDWANDDYYLVLDTSQESTIFDKYPIYRQERFDTILTDTTDAQDFSDVVFTKSNDVQTVIEVNIANWCAINRKIGDIITAYVDRPNHTVYGRCKCEVIGITINLSDGTMSLTLRLISRIDFTPYTQSTYYTDNEDSPNNNWYVGNDAGTDNRYYGMTINEGS